MIILTYNLQYDSKYVDNILENIIHVLSIYDIDFLLFQEATIYKKIIKIIDMDIYDYSIHKSGKETMITFYKKSYLLKKEYNGEFQKGRPFNIMLFKNKMTSKQFYLINIHACHNPNTKYAIIDKLNNILSNYNNKIDDIIIGGDFNRDILFDYIITTNSKEYKLKNIKNNIKTYNKYKYDHIISLHKPIKKKSITKYKNASDHKLILTELKN